MSADIFLTRLTNLLLEQAGYIASEKETQKKPRQQKEPVLLARSQFSLLSVYSKNDQS